MADEAASAIEGILHVDRPLGLFPGGEGEDERGGMARSTGQEDGTGDGRD
jgi:hypothetical protein